MDFTLIGIDVGTTATKATLIDGKGRELASFARPHPTDRSGPGKAEQSPQAWLDSVFAALHHFAASADLSGLAGIGLCSQVNTHVFVDGAGRPLRPAITWQDSRAAIDAALLDGQVTPERKTEWFGGPVPIDASHALSRMAFVARTEPDIWSRTRHVLLPKDFCALQLTGELASDPVAAVGLVDSAGNYVAPLLDLLPGAADRLPPLFAFHHVVGRIRPGLPCAGTPVVVGAMDAWGGMFGCGVVEDGDAMCQSGTSEIPGVVSTRVHPTPGVVLFPPYDGIRMHAAPTQAGGASLEWAAALLGRAPAELPALAATAGTGPIPFFLPHLAGERAPIWDAASRGSFARLDGGTGPAQLARAVLEGVAFSVRWAFEALEASAGRPIETVRISGGGSQSDIWCQIRADILGMRLERAEVPAAAALGAAILAGVGSGAFPSLAPAIRQLVRHDREFLPDAGKRAQYDEAFAHYQALYEALRPFNARFQSPSQR
ncbi:FGGY-family carbohydrate kinase [Devosia honganensis]|uniref:FGGY-family carbohydrate kinase n=1 Tax=Devosia honganensis TaxID=1610527 RepID=A0ABV7X3I9_9HYPH